jgi:hypothetical protein
MNHAILTANDAPIFLLSPSIAGVYWPVAASLAQHFQPIPRLYLLPLFAIITKKDSA